MEYILYKTFAHTNQMQHAWATAMTKHVFVFIKCNTVFKNTSQDVKY
jgi:hypothetical protein